MLPLFARYRAVGSHSSVLITNSKKTWLNIPYLLPYEMQTYNRTGFPPIPVRQIENNMAVSLQSWQRSFCREASFLSTSTDFSANPVCSRGFKTNSAGQV